MSDLKEHMLEVPLSSRRIVHLQTERTDLNHLVHLHAASVGCMRIKKNMHTEAGGCGMTGRESRLHGWGAAAKDVQGNGNPSQALPRDRRIWVP